MTEYKKAGLWGINGWATADDMMYSWDPDTVLVIYDYITNNRVVEYKQRNPRAQIIVRFVHPDNWLDEIEVSAQNTAREIIGKWQNDAVLRDLDPLIIIMNEPNLGGECGDHDIGNQWKYETPEHYANIGLWFGTAAKMIKEACPDMRLLPPPMAYGHKEDGEPSLETGEPKLGWAGYDYLEPPIKEYCDRNLAAHFYWGNGAGSNKVWLYPEQEGTWHAFRWQRVLKLWETRYGYQPTIWIDETGNFAPGDTDFTEQCEYYANNTLCNEYIGGLCFFLWDDDFHSSGNEINSWRAHVIDLPAHVERMKNLTVEIDKGEPTMWYQDFTEKARAYYVENGEALNDAVDYGVRVTAPPEKDGATFQFVVIGVHHLTGDENRRNHHIYGDVRDTDNNRMSSYLVQVTKENGEKETVMIDKPETEPGFNIPMYKTVAEYNDLQVLSVNDEYPCGTVNGLSSIHPDEDEYNTLYHHSFFVVWDLRPVTVVEPPIDPPIEPPVEPPVSPPDVVVGSGGCEGVVAISNAGILLASGYLSEAGYLEVINRAIPGDETDDTQA